MTKEMKILAMENRINLLQSRANRSNSNIVNKLRRQIQILKSEF